MSKYHITINRTQEWNFDIRAENRMEAIKAAKKHQITLKDSPDNVRIECVGAEELPDQPEGGVSRTSQEKERG